MFAFTKRGVSWLATLLFMFTVAVPVIHSSIASANTNVTSATINGGATTTVSESANIAVVIDVDTDTTPPASTPNWRSTQWRINTTPTATTGCVDHTNHDGAGSYSESFNVSAPSTAGLYGIRFRAFEGDACTGGQDQLNMDDTITVTAADITPPVIDAHADEYAEATGPAGAIVNYTEPNAVDAVDGTFPATCLPAPG